MKQKIFMMGMTVVFGLALTGCHMKHEWQEADCTQPQTCAVCGEIQGEALGHSWQEADCTQPQTCSVCGETQGEALGHSWQEADCTHPQICGICGETKGEALGHDWQEADYFTPQRCNVCGEEQGEPLQPSFEAHGLSANAKVGETYDYVTCCAADKSLTTVGKLTFSDYRIFEDTMAEGYEWRAVHIKIEFDDDNAQTYGAGVHYSNENYYDTEAWDQVYDRKDNKKLYTIHFNGKDYTECKSIFSGPGFGEGENGVRTWEGDAFVVVPAGYDGMVVCFRNAGLEEKTGDCIYDVADEDTIFFRMGDEGATVIPPAGAADPVSEKEETAGGDTLDTLVQTLTEKLSTQLSSEITDMLYDYTSSVLIYPFEDHVSLEILVGKPEYIPNMAAQMNDFLLENIGENFYSSSTVFIKYIDRKPDGSEDASSCERWFSRDGVTGEFISNPDKLTIDDCTISQLYDHYADKLGILDKEQTLEAIEERLLQDCQALLHEDAYSVMVTADEDEIVIYARTYKDYLIPALAGEVTIAVYEMAERTRLPLGLIRVYCADKDEKGEFVPETLVYWETKDMETGVFNSRLDNVYDDLYTIEDLYEYYEDYFDLMDKAMNGERVDEED